MRCTSNHLKCNIFWGSKLLFQDYALCDNCKFESVFIYIDIGVHFNRKYIVFAAQP